VGTLTFSLDKIIFFLGDIYDQKQKLGTKHENRSSIMFSKNNENFQVIETKRGGLKGKNMTYLW